MSASAVRVMLAAAVAVGSAMVTIVTPVAATTSTNLTAVANVAIPDDGYNGSLGSMASSTIDAVVPYARFVSDITVEVAINHTWAGDLTIKLQSPSGSIVALVQRPRGDAPTNDTTDDGSTTTGGDSSDLSSAYPLGFSDSFLFSPETMGQGITDNQIVCRDDARCQFIAYGDHAVTNFENLGDLRGEPADGNWTLYVGDSAPGDVGALVWWQIVIDHVSTAVDTFTSTPITVIADDAYNGTEASMATDSIDTFSIPVNHVVTDITVRVKIDHPYLGDLTIKLVGPDGTTVTLLDRPQGDDSANNAVDNGTTTADGDSSDLSLYEWLSFNDGYASDPEQLGLGINSATTACADASLCRFFPNADTAGGGSFAAFRGANSDGSWQIYVGDSGYGDVGTLYRWQIEIKHSLLIFGCTSPPFSDVAVSHPFCAEIKWMSYAGISNGFSDGAYRPGATVTRQAMSAFMARLADADLTPCAAPPFMDVPIGHPFCREIAWMNDAGISNGFGDGTYRPNAVVSRQAMSAFMARLSGAPLPVCTEAPFVDVPISNVFCKEIQWMRNTGISTGFSDGTYRPTIAVTRQSMSAFMQRANGVLP